MGIKRCSLVSAEQFKKVGDIIRADEEEDTWYIALENRESADAVTDMLYDCYRTAVAGRDFKKKLQNIKARYQEIIDGQQTSALDLSRNLKKSQKLCPRRAAGGTSPHHGEYLNGIVMANYLGYILILQK